VSIVWNDLLYGLEDCGRHHEGLETIIKMLNGLHEKEERDKRTDIHVDHHPMFQPDPKIPCAVRERNRESFRDHAVWPRPSL
jgi:hypothetical protein